MSEAGSALRWRTYGCPKHGHRPEETEDAVAVRADLGRFALADGASESAFAGDWARLLVAAYLHEPVRENRWTGWLEPIQELWRLEVGKRDLPWFLAEKFDQGAFATFLGLEILQRDGVWTWRAAAVGDCCLFHYQGATLQKKFPIVRSVDFDGSPDLLGSRQLKITRDFWAQGTLRPGDRIFAMSDALAQWFLKQVELGASPWREVLALDDTSFLDWIERQRQSKALRNDDVTLLVIELPSPGGTR